MLLPAIVLLCAAALTKGITEEEVEYFGCTGQPEMNTGLVGWVTVYSVGSDWVFESNNIPDHETGPFPDASTNPNAIEEQSMSVTLPKEPEIAETPSCMPEGPIAMAVNGVAMYNPWDGQGENAVEGDGAEVLDLCDGHPDPSGRYHYHKQPSSCLFDIEPGVPSSIIGVAYDGFAIYGPIDEYGNTLTSADLDECHGRYNKDGVYQYHTTADFPYILGCFRGTPRQIDTSNPRCYMASDADETGSVPNVGPPPGRPVQSLSRPARHVSPPADARIPRNLFKRRLPADYRDFLQEVIYKKR